MFQSLQIKLINYLVKNLIRPITDEDILKIQGNGDVIYKGKVLSAETKDKIQKDAENFAKSTIWSLLQDDALAAVYKKTVGEGQDSKDLILGKGAMLMLDALNTKIRKLSQLK